MQVGVDVICMYTNFVMSNACTSILVGIACLVLEILLLSKTAKFPFLTMDYSLCSSKNLIDWNRLKKFMESSQKIHASRD